MFFGLLEALLVVTHHASAALNRPWLFIAVAATSVAAVLLLDGDMRRKGAAARLYDDPDVLETTKVEAEFVKTGDVAPLAAYVAYHLAEETSALNAAMWITHQNCHALLRVYAKTTSDAS
jgi:hypothetical protein